MSQRQANRLRFASPSASPLPPRSGPIYFDQRWDGSGGIGRFAVSLRRELVDSFGYEFHDVQCGGKPFDWRDPWRLGRYLRRRDVGLFISPGYNVPAGAGCPTVITIHDLIHLSEHGDAGLAKRWYYRRLVRPAVRRGPLTLTVSNYSRDRIAEFADVPPRRVRSVGNGVDAAFVPADQNHPCRPPFFLYVGCDKPHKNLATLFTALASVSQSRQARLTMVVKPSARLRQQIDARGLTPQIDIVDDADESRLIDLYQHATATILPSHIEGFGLPIIEAMACGCPVITSDVTATAEVAGGAAITFPPDKASDLAAHMIDVLDSPLLRRHYVDAGLRRAAEFRWDHVARRTHAALREIGVVVGRKQRAA